MKHLFITDSFELLQAGHDSSLALMRAALQRNHEVWQAELHDIKWESCALKIKGSQINRDLTKGAHQGIFNLSQETDILVWMRKDPPVDEAYTRACQLLSLSKAAVINNPNSLLACEEKLFALQFPSLIPETHILSNLTEIKSLLEQKEQLIAKPIGGKAGEGILKLHRDDKNTGSLLELLTERGKRKIILQEYLPEAQIGDKRIFLCAGEPVGAVLRVAKKDENRANMAAGGSVEKTEVTPKEREICETLKPTLLHLGLYIVGLDVIGERLTEINITSPTCLEEIAMLDNSDAAGRIIDWSVSYFSQKF